MTKILIFKQLCLLEKSPSNEGGDLDCRDGGPATREMQGIRHSSASENGYSYIRASISFPRRDSDGLHGLLCLSVREMSRSASVQEVVGRGKLSYISRPSNESLDALILHLNGDHEAYVS